MPIFDYNKVSKETEQIEKFLHILKNTNKEIILFPAGTVSKGYFTALTSNGINISYFGDNSKNKVGTHINGLKVLSFEEIVI